MSSASGLGASMVTLTRRLRPASLIVTFSMCLAIRDLTQMQKSPNGDHAGSSGSRASEAPVTRFRTLTQWKALRSKPMTRQLAGYGSAQSVNRACVPKGVSLVQAVKVVIAYADAVPELTHLPFVVLAQEAIERAFPWPCK
jgi:Ssp1 endopeptidase immunity protein Rap1a